MSVIPARSVHEIRLSLCKKGRGLSGGGMGIGCFGSSIFGGATDADPASITRTSPSHLSGTNAASPIFVSGNFISPGLNGAIAGSIPGSGLAVAA